MKSLADRHKRVAAGAGILSCLALTLLLMHSYVFPLDSVTSMPADKVVADDEAHMIWSLWIADESLASGRNPYQTQMIFWPVGANLTRHTLVAGFAPVTFLIRIISGRDPRYPLYAFHFIILLCFSLLLGFSYLLLRRLGFTRAGSTAGAICFTFSDFFINHAIHLNIIAGFFLPLIAVLLVRVYQSPTFANLLILGLTSGASIYFTEMVVYIFTGTVFLALTLCLFRGERKILIDKVGAIGPKSILIVACVCALIIAPFLINFARAETLKPAPGESSMYSANLAGLVIPNAQRTPLYGNVFVRLDARVRAGEPTYETFAGFPLILLALAGVVFVRKHVVRMSMALALVFFTLSLGPTLKVFGTDTGVPLPYALLMEVPPFDLARTPVRFVIIAIFFLMIAAAGGFSFVQNSFYRRPARLLFIAAVLLWSVAEAYVPPLPRYHFIPPHLQTIVMGPVLNLPVSQQDGYAALLQIFHHQPIATGYISRNSEAQIAAVTKLEKLADHESGQFCGELMKMGYCNVIVNPASQVDAPFDLSGCALNVMDLRKPRASFSLYSIGTRIDLSQSEADRFLFYGWSDREATSRWTNRGRAIVAFRLDQSGGSKLRISLGPFLPPGKLNAQHVTIRMNNTELTTLLLTEATFNEYTIALPAGALQNENVLSFEIPDADSPRNVGAGEDFRLLGINVQWIEID